MRERASFQRQQQQQEEEEEEEEEEEPGTIHFTSSLGLYDKLLMHLISRGREA